MHPGKTNFKSNIVKKTQTGSYRLPDKGRAFKELNVCIILSHEIIHSISRDSQN